MTGCIDTVLECKYTTENRLVTTEGANMATKSDSSEYTINCPLLCGGESTLTIRGYERPGTVRPCACCKAQGGRDFTVALTQAEHYMRPVVTTTWQHKDGLVTFG